MRGSRENAQRSRGRHLSAGQAAPPHLVCATPSARCHDERVSTDVLSSGVEGRRPRRRWAVLVAVTLAVAAVAVAEHGATTRDRAAAAAAAARAVGVGPSGYGAAGFALVVDNASARPIRVGAVSVTLAGAALPTVHPDTTVAPHGALVVRLRFDGDAGCPALTAGAGAVRLRVTPPGGNATEIRRALPRFQVSPLGAAWETALGAFTCPAR
jgi:hypothetical protein